MRNTHACPNSRNEKLHLLTRTREGTPQFYRRVPTNTRNQSWPPTNNAACHTAVTVTHRLAAHACDHVAAPCGRAMRQRIKTRALTLLHVAARACPNRGKGQADLAATHTRALLVSPAPYPSLCSGAVGRYLNLAMKAATASRTCHAVTRMGRRAQHACPHRMQPCTLFSRSEGSMCAKCSVTEAVTCLLAGMKCPPLCSCACVSSAAVAARCGWSLATHATAAAAAAAAQA